MIWKRLLAFLIDYLIIVVYGILLFGLSSSLIGESSNPGPVKGQLIGLFTMTIPVFLYFYLLESGRSHATIGKRLMKIRVVGVEGNYFIRNLLKFLPWEVAHAGVHWVMYFSWNMMDVPVWTWTLLILPQILVIMFMISIVLYKGKSSLYDKVAKTIVQSGEVIRYSPIKNS